MLCPLYMAEISPPEFRGALMAMEQFSIVLGCVLGFWAGFFTREGTSFLFDMKCNAQLSSSRSPTPYRIQSPETTLHGDLFVVLDSLFLFRTLRASLCCL